MTMHLAILQDKENALHLAAKSGHVNAINILLSKNTDLIIQIDNVSEHLYVYTSLAMYKCIFFNIYIHPASKLLHSFVMVVCLPLQLNTIIHLGL